MATALFFSFLGSLLICMALIPPLTASAGRLHVLDVPGGRKLHSGAVAKVGGIALATGTFIGVLMWAPKDNLILGSLLGGLTILLFGVWDDRVGLAYRTKFAGQAVGAFIVIAIGGVQIGSLPLVPDAWLTPWLTLPLTFLVLLAVTNAVNLADGLDGLAGGLSLISFAGTAFLAFQAEDALLMLMLVSVLGGLLGFLRFNTYPARIFMGDAGSQFLGFYLGVTGLVLSDPVHGPYSFLVALFLWGLPLLDTVGVMAQRWREGRSPFVADRNHLHHKLLGMGWSHGEAVTIIYGLQIAMVALAYAMRWQPDWVLFAAYAAIALGVVLLYLRPLAVPAVSPSEPGRSLAPAAGFDSFPRLGLLPLHLLVAAVSGFLLVSVLRPLAIPSDVGFLAAALLAGLALGERLWPALRPLFVRIGLYVGTTIVLYVSEQGEAAAASTWLRPANAFLIMVALLVLLTMRMNVSGRFETTPLDSLTVLTAILLPFLPEMQIGEVNVSLLAAKLIVLFFSFEILLYAYPDRIKQAGALGYWLLGGLIVHAWWR